MATGIQFNGKSLFVTPKGIKYGSKGKVQFAGMVLGQMSKGEARRLRKSLRRLGHNSKAAATRQVA